MGADHETQRRDDAHWMRRALSLARRRAGQTWPNPTVGACVVREGRLLAEAAHVGAGHAHAEAAALEELRSAGVDPAGSTVYVTLEPCHHQGRTPPCSRALVAAGIARVVYAHTDDSSRHEGGGARWLAEQGVEVEAGLLGECARELNHPFFETQRDDEVHLTLKLALTLDGRMALGAGPAADPEARRITGSRAHRRVHGMRAGASAVLVGRRTAEWDRPRLDVRGLPASRTPRPGPRPVILDPSLRLDPGLLPPRSLVIHGPQALPGPGWAEAGIELAAAETTAPGRLDWDAITATLGRAGLGVVLVEGGACVAADLVAAAKPHRIHLFVAPRLVGGDGASLGALPGLERRYRTLRVRRVGEDLEWVLVRDDLPR